MERPAEAPPVRNPLVEPARADGRWERCGQKVDFVWNGRHRKPRIRQVLRWTCAEGKR
jgi:hypothetical protein